MILQEGNKLTTNKIDDSKEELKYNTSNIVSLEFFSLDDNANELKY